MILNENDLIADGKYRVNSFIAQGAHAEVWLVEKVEEGKTFALKILRPKWLSNSEITERFRREYQILKRLEHPSIVGALDFGYHSYKGFNFPWYAMEYYPLNFRQRLAQGISIGEGLRLLQQVLDGLSFAHANKIYHRDLKPVNILIDTEGEAALGDFGIAKDVGRQQTTNLTKTGHVMGTLHYLPPEQMRGEPLVAGSDLYSMGIIFFELCAGRLPFDEKTLSTGPMGILRAAPLELGEINPAISHQLAHCVMRCLEKDPADRYGTVDALRHDLITCPEINESIERTLQPGQVIADQEFRVQSLIEQGGYAEVYLVKKVATGKSYALKIQLPAHAFDPDSIKRFEREITILESLDHPNIMKIVASGRHLFHDLSLPFFVMEFYPGNLRTSMNEEFDRNRAYDVIVDVLGALQYTHEARGGVIHADMKPANILIDAQGKGCLTDFNIAKISKSFSNAAARNATQTRTAMGTYSYMSPEQIRGVEIDTRTDIYSLGVILYEIACGRRPFDNASAEVIASMHLTEQPKPPRQFDQTIPPRLEHVILKCLQKEADQRCQTVSELESALEESKIEGAWFSKKVFLPFRTRLLSTTKNTVMSPGPYLSMAAASAIFFVGLLGAGLYANISIGLKISRAALSPTKYTVSYLSGVARRITDISTVFQQGSSAIGIPEAASAAVPLEFLPASFQRGFAALKEARVQARDVRDISLVKSLDSKMKWMLGEADLPELRIDPLRTKRMVQTNQPTADFELWFADASELDLDPKQFAIDYVVRDASGREVARSASPRPAVQADRAASQQEVAGSATSQLAVEADDTFRLRVADLAQGQYKVTIEATFASEQSEARYPLDPVEWDFEIREVVKPVRVVRASSELEWSLENSGEFASWLWVLKNLDTGDTRPLPGSADQQSVRVDEATYRQLGAGNWSVVCEARDPDPELDEPYLSIADEQHKFVVDNTPPTIEVAGGVSQVTLLPSDGPFSIEFVGRNDGGGALQFLEVVDGASGSFRGLNGSTREVMWQDPGSDGFGRARLSFRVQDLDARFDGALSEPVAVDVYSLSRQSALMLELWTDQERRIGAAAGRYSRTNRMAPLGDFSRIVESPGVISRAWLEAGATGPNVFPQLEELYSNRKTLAAADDRFAQRVELYNRILAPAPPEHRPALEADIESLVTAWRATSEPGETPERLLASLNENILPSPPGEGGGPYGEAFAVVRDRQAPLNSEISIKPDFARRLGDEVQYRYTLVTEDPGAEPQRLIALLSQGGRINDEGHLLPLVRDLDRPHYLVIQTYMKLSGEPESFRSEPRVYPIDPLVTLSPEAVDMLGTYAEKLSEIESAQGDTYARTLAWTQGRGYDFGTQERANKEWLVKNSHLAQATVQLAEALQIGQYAAGDLRFTEEKRNQVQARASDWPEPQVESLNEKIVARWVREPLGTEPAPLIEMEIEDFIENNLNPQVAERMANFATLLSQMQSRPGDTFERTLAWVERSRFPFGADGGANRQWQIDNFNQPGALGLVEESTKIQDYMQNDERFAAQRSAQLDEKARGWVGNHRETLEESMREKWLGAGPESAAARFVSGEIRSYIGAQDSPLLAPPAAPAREVAITLAEQTFLDARALGFRPPELDDLRLAWGTSESDFSVQTPSWKPTDSGRRLNLRSPPAELRTYVLAMRFERQVEDQPLRSDWRVINSVTRQAPPEPTPEIVRAIATATPPPPLTTGSGPISLAEAREFAQTSVQSALPARGSGRRADEALRQMRTLGSNFNKGSRLYDWLSGSLGEINRGRTVLRELKITGSPGENRFSYELVWRAARGGSVFRGTLTLGRGDSGGLVVLSDSK